MSLKVSNNLMLFLVIISAVKCQLAPEMGRVRVTHWIALLFRYETQQRSCLDFCKVRIRVRMQCWVLLSVSQSVLPPCSTPQLLRDVSFP